MNLRSARWSAGFALLCLSLGTGCIKAKKGPSDDDMKRLAPYVLSEAPAIMTGKLDADFDGKAKLVGYTVSPLLPKTGESVTLTMYWKCEQRFDRGWRLFSHLMSNGGADPIGNLDTAGPLREAVGEHQMLGPEFWEPGKVYADEVKFEMPDVAGGLQVVAGIWRDNDRIKLLSGRQLSDNRAIVWSVQGTPRTVPTLSVNKLAAGTAINIDGKDDEAAWSTAANSGAFVNVANGNPAAEDSVQGSVKLLWDATNLYAFYRVKDKSLAGKEFEGTKGDETHTATGQPKLWTKDTIEMMVDPDGDGDNVDYYEIQVSPNNLVFRSQFDTLQKPNGGPNGPFGHEDWELKMKTATTVQGTVGKSGDDSSDEGYTVEMAIPWAAFSKAKKAPPASGDTWRMNFYAMENNGGVAWSPILGRGNFHHAPRFGRVSFVDPAAPALEVTPGTGVQLNAPGAKPNPPVKAVDPVKLPGQGAIKLRNPKQPAPN